MWCQVDRVRFVVIDFTRQVYLLRTSVFLGMPLGVFQYEINTGVMGVETEEFDSQGGRSIIQSVDNQIKTKKKEDAFFFLFFMLEIDKDVVCFYPSLGQGFPSSVSQFWTYLYRQALPNLQLSSKDNDRLEACSVFHCV